MSEPNEENNMSQMVWQSQPVEAPRISLEFVRLQVEKLQARFRCEYYGMVGMSSCLAILLGTLSYRSSIPLPRFILTQLGGFLVLAGTLFLTYLTHRRLKALMINKGEQVLQSLEAYRAVLEQHRDHHLGTWPGVLWVMGPAMLVLFAGGLLYDERPNKLLRYMFIFLWFFFGMLWVAKYSKRKARQFQRELDALATMDKQVSGQ